MTRLPEKRSSGCQAGKKPFVADFLSAVSEGEGSFSPRVLRSEELFQGAREALILHADQVYRLLQTRNGKLILHK